MRESRNIQIKKARKIIRYINNMDIDRDTLYPKIGKKYILAVDRGNDISGDMSAASLVAKQGDCFKVLATGVGRTHPIALDLLKYQMKNNKISCIDAMIEKAKTTDLEAYIITEER